MKYKPSSTLSQNYWYDLMMEGISFLTFVLLATYLAVSIYCLFESQAKANRAVAALESLAQREALQDHFRKNPADTHSSFTIVPN